MAPLLTRVRQVSWRRLLAGGVLTAILAGAVGVGLERWWFGPDDPSAAARVEASVRREFDRMTQALASVATGIASDPAAIPGLTSGVGTEGARTLFDLLANVRARHRDADAIAVTVYDDTGLARAWSGRPSDIPADRTSGGADLFAQRSALGLRLVHVYPITSDSRRLGAVAVEHVLSQAVAGAAIGRADDSLHTALAPVTFRLPSEGAGEQQPRLGTFVLRTPAGQTLVEASVSTADLQRSRVAWRRSIVSWVIVILGLTLLLLIGPLLDTRLLVPQRPRFVSLTLLASLLLAVGAGAIWVGLVWWAGSRRGLPINLAFSGLALTALAALWVSPATQLQFAFRSRRHWVQGETLRFAVTHLLAGITLAICTMSIALVLSVAVDPTTVDVRHFSFYPWSGSRVLRLVGILSVYAGVSWVATLALVATRGAWRLPPRAPAVRAALLALWLAPTGLALGAATMQGWQLPVAALLTSATACAVAALLARRVVSWYRRATIAARIFALFLTFLIPAILLYPSLDFFAERAIQNLIANQYAVEAQNHSEVLRQRLAEAKEEIDALTILPELVAESCDPAAPVDTDRAFQVWRRSVLAQDRLTSAVELYDRAGCLVSRFNLNLPEYTGSGQQPQAISSCNWDVFAEPLPIGSNERQVLHAERGICLRDPNTGSLRSVGTIIVHVAFDFRTLPFITSQSPYFELFRPNRAGMARELAPGNDLHVVIYGWGLQPLYTSGLSAWPITDPLFQRIYQAGRVPFWETIPLGNDRYRVYFTNDRARIYAIGYPLLTLFDHLVHLAELSTLAATGFLVVLLGAAVFRRLSRQRPRVGRALLREIRASFYRKLFLAFVAASIIPVLVLAVVIRVYFADLLRTGIQAEAVRTAAVAQRVIEESDALLRRGAEGVGPVNDEVMVWIRQVIDQDVNIYDGPELVATSERDLFSSGLLPTRTPDDVYRAIELQRLPSFVDEDQLGALPYLIAATPVRAAGRNTILTVPLAARQQEIARQRYDLDRGVHLAVMCFILLGAAIGLSLAERIADPIRRLTRATQRIGRGDFDARIAVKSADELRRLVDAFNSMAGELKAQRAELERTHRLEAWAEMARQVAHEIKNPLTPIQLSAEHLRRVHEDRGRPLGSVLEGCVDTILGQVRLLRQISAEFSNFASSPHVKPAPVEVPVLVAEVLDPYRTGLVNRIAIHNNVPDALPRVLADRALILRALANIIENALHAMPGKGELFVDAAAEPDAVGLTVRDTGFGMDEHALARVFEPYFSTKASGTGLGLPMARRNVELNGGTIEVESRKGEGTTVFLRLPLAPS